jgi:uncharacterized protein
MGLALLKLIGVLLAVGVALCAVMVYLMARMLLRPNRMTDGKAAYVLKRLSPMDLGIEFEEIPFDVQDENAQKLRVAAWWMENANGGDRSVILIHGYGDAKVGAIAWAPLLRSFGFHILAIDLRAHGESGGALSTAGYWERHDVSQVIDQIKAQRPGETREVVLFGISLGAAVAAAVGAMRDDVTAVVMESPFSDYQSAVMAHARLSGMPGPVFVKMALRVAERMSAADFEAVRPDRIIPQVKGRVMVVAAGDDPLVGDTSDAALQAAVARRNDGSVYWMIPAAYHVEGMMGDFDEYRRRVGEFLAPRSTG